MDKREFDGLFDPETLASLMNEFQEIDIARQKAAIKDNAHDNWYQQLSVALSDDGVDYYRDTYVFDNDEELDILFVRIQKQSGFTAIPKPDMDRYLEAEIPPVAVSAAIKAGLLAPGVFQFWGEVDYNDD